MGGTLASRGLVDLSASQEMYLKTIYLLCEEHKVARVKDIAAQLTVTMSSVNGAIKTLTSRNLCTHNRYGYVDLTEDGREAAQHIIDRYNVMTRFLHQILGVDQSTADGDACEMEHIVSPQTLDRFAMFIEYVDENSNEAQALINSFQNFLDRRLKE